MRENRNISETMWNFTALLYLLLLSTIRPIVWHQNQACKFFFEVTSGSSAEILQTSEKIVINTEHAPEQYKYDIN